MDKWICTSERLPPQDVYVLVAKWDSRKNVRMFFTQIAKRLSNNTYESDTGESIRVFDSPITHWMLLPDNPGKNNISDDDQKIINEGWKKTFDHVKTLVNDVFDFEDIKYEVYAAMRDGVKEYLQEYDEGKILEILSDSVLEKIRCKQIKLKMEISNE